jgi:hypothetical protein
MDARDELLNHIMDVNVKMHSDEQHAMSSEKLGIALMLTVEFSEMYYTRKTVPNLSLEQ